MISSPGFNPAKSLVISFGGKLFYHVYETTIYSFDANTEDFINLGQIANYPGRGWMPATVRIPGPILESIC